MADSPAPVSTPASAGFKLKLKLGGNSIGQHARTASLASGNDGSNATPSTSTSASTSVPASTAPASAVAAAPPAQPADVSMDIETEGDAEPDLLDADPDADADDLYMDQTSQPDDADDGDFTVGTSKKSKAKAKAGGSSTPTFTYSSAPLEGQGGTVMPTGHYDSTGQLGTSLQVPPPAKKRKAPTANPGAGRGWRKGLKNSEKQEGVSLSLTGKAASGTPPPSTASAPLPGKRRKAAVNMAEDGAAEDDQDEDFVPMMVAPGGLATSDKWQNGLPGGNEQSRQTAAMAAAVNKLFPVGPPPKTGSGFLPSQPLDKRTPKPRSWKKARREIVGPGGAVFYVPVWIGDKESPYASHMIEHPRPPPVDKKALAASLAANTGEAGSPHAEYAGSDGVSVEGGAAKKRKRAPGEPKRKPGPPKKAKAGTPIAPIAAPGMASATPAPVMADAAALQTPPLA